MVKIFRQHRLNQNGRNKILRYFLYAIGEIVLVVIGILIALQINNWNENKLEKENEREFLLALKSSFLMDLDELEKSKIFYDRSKRSMRIILEYIDKDLPYQDSLKIHFFNTMIVFGSNELDSSVYESIKSSGIDIIYDENIRNQIIYLFEISDSYLKKFESQYLSIILDASKNILNTRFDEVWNGDYKDENVSGEMIPLDFELLKKDQQYIYFLKSLRNQHGYLIDKPMETTEQLLNELIGNIETELKRD